MEVVEENVERQKQSPRRVQDVLRQPHTRHQSTANKGGVTGTDIKWKTARRRLTTKAGGGEQNKNGVKTGLHSLQPLRASECKGRPHPHNRP